MSSIGYRIMPWHNSVISPHSFGRLRTGSNPLALTLSLWERGRVVAIMPILVG